jgi:hypothetical protein
VFESKHKLQVIILYALFRRIRISKNIGIQIYGTIILPVVMNECENWSVRLRKERKLRVYEHRALRKIFGPKRDEVTEVYRKLHKEEHYDLYSSPNAIRVIK